MKKIRKWSILGTIFTLVFGTILHFVYDWFGGGIWAILGIINESTWEHLKLVFWPIVIFSFFEYQMYKPKPKGFLPIRVLTSFIAMLSIIVLFYTYSGVLGFTNPAVNISIFVIGVIVAYGLSYKCFKHPPRWFTSPIATIFSVVVWVAMMVCFIAFTYYPPHIGLFLDPTTSTYGIQ